MALSKIDTAGLAADAVDNTIVDLADNYTYSGNVNIPGHVVQVASAPITTTTQLSTSSSTYSDLLDYSITFTPKFSNSKLLITWTFHVYLQEDSSWQGADTRLTADGTSIFDGGSYGISHNFNDSTVDRFMVYATKQYVHTVTSTSAVTYKIQGAKVQSGGTNRNAIFNGYSSKGSFIIQEIAQ